MESQRLKGLKKPKVPSAFLEALPQCFVLASDPITQPQTSHELPNPSAITATSCQCNFTLDPPCSPNELGRRWPWNRSLPFVCIYIEKSSDVQSDLWRSGWGKYLSRLQFKNWITCCLTLRGLLFFLHTSCLVMVHMAISCKARGTWS